MDIYSELAQKIIKEQETILGPVAIEQAQKVEGLTVDKNVQNIIFNGDKKLILEKLVQQYQNLFGLTSVEVCREAVRGVISQAAKDQIPQVLL
jgi:hypothetical protein